MYQEKITLQLFSLTGKVLLKKEVSDHNGLLEIDVRNLANGIYILKGSNQSGQELFQKKIIR